MDPNYDDDLKRQEARKEKSLPVPFLLPPNPDQKIWRILGIGEFTQILTGELPLRWIGEFPDKLEGEIGQGARKALLRDQDRDSLEKHIERNEATRSAVSVSCWRMDDDECCKAWVEYSKRDSKKLAIESTVFGLWDSCPKTLEGLSDASPRIGMVQYIDFHSGGVFHQNGYMPYTHKHIKYCWEKEIRVFQNATEIEAKIRHGTIDIATCKSPNQVLKLGHSFQITRVVAHPNSSESERKHIDSLLLLHSRPVKCELSSCKI